MKSSGGKIKSFVALAIFLAWIVTIGVGASQRQAILDYLKLRGYQPTASISGLATAVGMTPLLRHDYYVNHPSIETKTSFRLVCPNGGGEQTIILGCYRGGQSGIFLLGVSDNRLQGVVEVTAAHEALHSAYERLSGSERKRIDAMLVSYYQNQLKDERVKRTIDAYRASEPNDLVNEMHSIFATELPTLTPELESYYQRYFNNRALVTGFAAGYQAEFSSRQATIKQDDADLALLKTQIDADERSLSDMQAQITSRQQSLESQRSRDPAAYNAGVAGYNAFVDRYNAQVQTLKQRIGRYNAIVASRNALASQIAELSNALSTDAKTIQ